jgi:hypothetical protein
VASQFGLPRERSGTGRTEITRTFGIRNWTQTGQGAFTRTLCQKKEGTVKIKQRPIKMGERTIYRAPFILGQTDDPTCERCVE